MMEIKLTRGYFIEPDEFQFTLKQNYTFTGKDGSEKEAVRTVSFHRTLEQAVEKYLSMLQGVLQPDKALSMREYVKMVTRENKAAIKAIESLVIVPVVTDPDDFGAEFED